MSFRTEPGLTDARAAYFNLRTCICGLDARDHRSSAHDCEGFDPDWGDVREWLETFQLGPETVPTEAGERKAFTNNEETPMHCCEMECGKDAEFAIYGDSDHPEDYTHACADHVGHLLGTPDWLVEERGGKENVRWNVVVLTDPRTEP